MPVDWMDTSDVSFEALLLLEREQLGWFPGWLPEPELGIALHANPAVAWFMRHKNPDVADWVDQVMVAAETARSDADAVRDAERAVLRSVTDLLVYALDPAIYDAQPFHGWDTAELTGITDFTGKVVLDVGCGTGRLAFAVAESAASVYAIDPVENLRRYVKAMAAERGLSNVFAVDGLITDLPFADGFADVTMGGHVFGDHPEEELAELMRVTRAGGMVILCPGSHDADGPKHDALVSHGFAWDRFEEPCDGWKRKYWRTA